MMLLLLLLLLLLRLVVVVVFDLFGRLVGWSVGRSVGLLVVVGRYRTKRFIQSLSFSTMVVAVCCCVVG